MKASSYRPLPPTLWQQLTAPLRKALGMQQAKPRYYDERLGIVWDSLPKQARPCLGPKYDHYSVEYSAKGHKQICMRKMHGKPKAHEMLEAALQAPSYVLPSRRKK